MPIASALYARITDRLGCSTQYRYNVLDRLIEIENAIGIGYTADDREGKVRDPKGSLIDYSSDAASQLIKWRVNEVEITRYQYDIAGYVLLFEIENDRSVTILAVRHQREEGLL